MDCKTCKTTTSIKDTEEWVSIRCKCGMRVIYPDGTVKFITKEAYNPQHTK